MTMVPALDLRPANEDAKALPNNIDAEQAVLGILIYDNEVFPRVDWLTPEAFYEPIHSELFAAVIDLIGARRLAEPVVLTERFKDDGRFLDIGGLNYLADLVDKAPPPPNVTHYAEIVRDLAIKRDIIRTALEAITGAERGDVAASEVLETAEQALFRLAEGGKPAGGFEDFSTAVDGALDTAAQAYGRDGGIAGIATHLIDLDQKLGGLHPSDLIILAGRPSMGKTALATSIAFNVASRYSFDQMPDGSRKLISGGVVGFFSLEMSREQLAMRLMADAAGVSADRIRRGDVDANEFRRLRDASELIRRIPLHIDDTGALSIAKLAARARRLKRTKGLDLIVVDYLQLIAGIMKSGDNRVQEVSQITAALKALAKELDVPVIALSQLSRKVEERDDKRPQLSDLRESGSIEQDADIVAFVYREAYYLGRAEPKTGTDEHIIWQTALSACRFQAEVIIGKQRHGPIGTVRLSFNEETTKFGNLAREGRFEGARLPYGAED